MNYMNLSTSSCLQITVRFTVAANEFSQSNFQPNISPCYSFLNFVHLFLQEINTSTLITVTANNKNQWHRIEFVMLYMNLHVYIIIFFIDKFSTSLGGMENKVGQGVEKVY